MEYSKFIHDLRKHLNYYMYQRFSHIIILCIGTNKLIGDSIGPMVGQILEKELQRNDIVIYGNMYQTINFKNARKTIENILEKYEKPFVITIDSALGTNDMINRIIVNQGFIKIGKALGRSICYYSHINIKAIVGENNHTIQDNIQVLKDVNPEIVMELSDTMAKGIKDCLKN